MSYSFSVRAASKAAAVEKVAEELAKVVQSQPVHAADRQQAEAAAGSMLAVFPEPTDEQDITVSVSGWLSWTGSYPDSHVISQASVTVAVGLAAKAVAAA